MKKLLTITVSLFALIAGAQTTTNIAFKITVETVSGGTTNNAVSNFRFDSGGTKADQIRIDGAAMAYATYRSGGGTNAFEVWLKQDVKDRLKEYADAKAHFDNAATAAKISSLLLQNPDLLSASDLSNLATISAKAP